MDDIALSGRYLGQLTDIRRPDEGGAIGLVLPIFEATPDGAVWATELTKPKNALSDSGLALWHGLPEDASVRTYWNFSIRLSPTYAPPQNRERYEVVDATPVVEALDLWRRKWTEGQIRERLTGEGVFLKSPPIGSLVMIWYAKDEWVGPVELTPGDSRGVWKIADGFDLRGLTVYRPPEPVKRPVSVAGHPRHLVSPSGDLGQWIKGTDWTPDHLLIATILGSISELGGNTLDAVAATDGILKQYQESLKAAGLIGTDLRAEVGTPERVTQLGDTLVRNGNLLQKAASIFQDYPEVRAQIDQRTQAIYEKLKEEQSALVEAELAEARAELDRLRGELAQCTAQAAFGQKQLADTTEAIGAGTAKLELIRAELAGKEAELETARDVFREKLEERLRDLIKSPETLFGEYATIRAILGAGEMAPVDSVIEPLPHAAIAASPKQEAIAAKILTVQKDVIASLGQAARARGFSPQLGVHLAAAFVSGATPVVTGPRAFDALSAFASVAVGGRLTWIPVGPTTMEPRDLLGTMLPGAHSFLPHPGGLLDVLLEAEVSEALHLVVLEGFDRAPTDSYLQPLLECRMDGWMGKAVRTIPVATRNSIPAGDPYAGVGRVRWPSNVLLALIPSEGANSFPLSDTLWRQAVLVDTGSSIYRTGTTGAVGEIPASEIASGVWATWREGVVQNRPKTDPNPLEKIYDDYDGEPEMMILAGSTYAAARTLSLSEQTSFAFAVRASLLPTILAAAGESAGIAKLAEIHDSDVERTRSLLGTDRK